MGWREGYPDDWDQRRKAIYKRDGYACQNCGRRGGPTGTAELHCHHIVPKSKGGSHHPSNLITLCWKCHNAQHDHHISRNKRPSSTSGSPGHDRDEMDAATKRLQDIYLETSDETIDTDSQPSEPDDSGDIELSYEDIDDDSSNEDGRIVELLWYLGWFFGIPVAIFILGGVTYFTVSIVLFFTMFSGIFGMIHVLLQIDSAG